MPASVAIVAALDTKGEEARFLRDAIAGHGVPTLLVDIGIVGPTAEDADVGRATVARAGGADLADLVRSADKARAMETMARGGPVILSRLYAEGRISGAIGIGGSSGTAIATSAMRALPVGVPTLMVSTVAAGDTRAYIGAKDITMMFSVVDIAGINRISARILTNAAAAIAGMVQARPPEITARPLIAASMFGNTTPCVDHARGLLDAAGYEVLVFHATGAGGRTMERLIGDGYFAGVLDLTTTEWADELAGGVFSAGPERMDAAARAGVPQVIAPGCLDMVNFNEPETVPERYRDRRFYHWNPNVTLMRTTPEENAALGRIVAEKANASTGPVTILLPLDGVSQLDSPGGAFWWPEADAALFTAIRSHARAEISVVALDCNINDPAFAAEAVRRLRAMLPAR